MATKEFGGKKKELHQFKLEGKIFHVYPSMSVGYLRRTRTTDVAENLGTILDQTVEFLTSMIIPSDREAFLELVNSPEIYLEASDLFDISNWIIEVITGRPTESPSSSSNGAGRTKSGSKPNSSSQAKKKTSKALHSVSSSSSAGNSSSKNSAPDIE